MKKTSKYSQSEIKLREFIYNNEKERRIWANERWTHQDGSLFSLGRILAPVLSVIGIFVMFIVCMVRFANIPEINIALANNGQGTSDLIKDDPFIYPFFLITFVLFNLLIFASIKFIKKSYKTGTYIICISSFLLMMFAFIRRGADSGIFPDNTEFSGAPMLSYNQYCLISAAVFALLFIYSIILIIIYLKDNKELNKIVERALIKIIPSDNKSLLSDDEYSDLIEDYIKEETNRINNSKIRKNGKKSSTLFVDEEH